MSRGTHASSADSSFGSGQLLDAQVCGEVGARLGASRSGREWTHADVANRLLLSTAQVHGLESADASAFHNPAFFAAALRKYATLMAIDCPDAILAPKSSPGVRSRSDRGSTVAAPGAPRASRFSVPMEWLAVATIVVLAGTGFVLYFGGRKPPPAEAAAQPPAPVADVKNPRSDVSPPAEPVDRADASPPKPLSTSAPAIPTPVPADRPAAASSAAVDQAPAGVVTLARPAWVFVRYGDNSVTQRTLQAGQSLTLTSTPIYLAIGAGEGVTLTIRERPVDVSPFRNGNEIRISASDLAAFAR